MNPRPAGSHDTSTEIDLAGRHLADWEAMGPHRTGTPGERASARWLAGLAADAGLRAQVSEYAFLNAQPGVCRLALDEAVIEGYPMLDGGQTGAQGLQGRLALPGGTGEIGLIEVAPNGEYDPGFRAARTEGGWRALVAVTRGGAPGLSLVNAGHLTHPDGPPVLQVSSDEGERLREAARLGRMARLTVEIGRVEARACNVVARVDDGSGRPPLAVVTPRSGWWHCTGERGGGLIAWLAIARAVGGARPSRPVVMTANSGHEIGHLGMDAFEACHPGLLRDAHAWLHLGANLGCRGGRVVVQSSDAAWLALARRRLGAQGLAIARELGPGERPFGEARNIFDRGGRYLSLLGTAGPLFHHPDDRLDTSVDLAAVVAISRAAAELALDLVG